LEGVQVGCCDVPKLCISSVAMKFVKNISKHLSRVIIPAESNQKETESTSNENASNLSFEGKKSQSCDQSNDSNLTQLLNFY
jgi:hypothetical protein